jgi:hypothetical protein
MNVAESPLDPKAERVQDFDPNLSVTINNSTNDATTYSPLYDVTMSYPLNDVTSYSPLSYATLSNNPSDVTNVNILTDSQVNRCDCGNAEQIVKLENMISRYN